MYLGLDLRGGIHVLIDVDMDAAVQQAVERYSGDIRVLLRNEKVRYLRVAREGNLVMVKFKDAAKRDEAENLINNEFRNLVHRALRRGGCLFAQGQSDTE